MKSSIEIGDKNSVRNIYRLDDSSTKRFVEQEEVFPSSQLGFIDNRNYLELYLVVDALIAVRISHDLANDLGNFYHFVWGDRHINAKEREQKYIAWLGGLNTIRDVFCMPISRSGLQHFAATGNLPATPPLPPTRPTIAPAGTVVPAGIATIYGHLPFQDVSTNNDIYYRFEAFPSSRRVTIGNNGSVVQGTYASPKSELPFLPTGFAAVARNALPSFFPAVYRYELEPVPGAKLLCGASVPLYGQSGGGVEVMYLDPTTNNRVAIPPPAIIDPL